MWLQQPEMEIGKKPLNGMLSAATQCWFGPVLVSRKGYIDYIDLSGHL